MEIATEVNRIFGTEMAKLFADSISEEEMKKKAEGIWRKLNNTGGNSWNRESEIDTIIKSVFKERLKESVITITETEEFQERIASMAQGIVDDIITKTREKMVEGVSDRLACLSTGRNGYGLYDYIASGIDQMTHRG